MFTQFSIIETLIGLGPIFDVEKSFPAFNDLNNSTKRGESPINCCQTIAKYSSSDSTDWKEPQKCLHLILY
jgi:hypothetical protein